MSTSRRSIIENDYAKIPLFDGNLIIVDKEFAWLDQYKWHYGGTKKYPIAWVNGKHVRIHHLILGKPKKGFEIDHVNRNIYDNRRINLRFATRSDNSSNKIKQKNNTTGYKGVSWHKKAKKYQYQLRKNGIAYGGLHEDPKEAALLYDSLARQLYGEFAQLNFRR